MGFDKILKVIIRVVIAYLHKTLDIDRPVPTIGDEECLPIHLRDKKHDDFPWPLSLIPRSWTIVCGADWPEAPELLAGNSGWTLEDRGAIGHHTEEFIEKYGAVFPIPKPKHWVITAVMYDWIPLPYFAITFPNRWHFRIGLLRWDDVDSYFEVGTLAFHKID